MPESTTVHFDVPDLELRVDRGTPCETLVHRVHSDVKLSLFLLAALRAIAWRNSPALALAGAELGVSACVRDPYLQVAPRARVAFVAGLSALLRVLVYSYGVRISLMMMMRLEFYHVIMYLLEN